MKMAVSPGTNDQPQADLVAREKDDESLLLGLLQRPSLVVVIPKQQNKLGLEGKQDAGKELQSDAVWGKKPEKYSS